MSDTNVQYRIAAENWQEKKSKEKLQKAQSEAAQCADSWCVWFKGILPVLLDTAKTVIVVVLSRTWFVWFGQKDRVGRGPRCFTRMERARAAAMAGQEERGTGAAFNAVTGRLINEFQQPPL